MFHRYGGADEVVLEDLALPDLGDHHLLIRVQAASVNRSDWEALSGRPVYVRLSGSGLRTPKRGRLGSDVAGVVEQVGGRVTRFAPGDRVFGDMLWAGPGAFAEHMWVHEETPLVHIPAGLSFAVAAALPQAAGLAWQALTERSPVEAGDAVLVNGGGGGSGTFAIQLAKHAGAIVTGIDTAEKRAVMVAAGADDTVDFTTDRSLGAGRTYDKIIDFAGGRSVMRFARALRPRGSYVMIGGSIPDLLGTVIGGGIISVVTSRTMRLMMAKSSRENLRALADLVVGGELQPIIDRSYPLAEVREAMRYFGDNHTKGKLVIIP